MDTSTSVEATVTSVASKSMGGGATAGVWGWMTSNEAVATTGVMIAVLGFIVNLIFQVRRDRREQELQRVKLAAIAHGQKDE